MTRPLRPRVTAALSVVPATVTDLTAPAVLGLEPRHFRELLEAQNIRHARLGRRVLARLEDVLAAIDGLTGKHGAGSTTEQIVDEEPTADALLARIGRRRA